MKRRQTNYMEKSNTVETTICSYRFDVRFDVRSAVCAEAA
jgi:hypothetical protein